jgi:hypothetical protein
MYWIIYISSISIFTVLSSVFFGAFIESIPGEALGLRKLRDYLRKKANSGKFDIVYIILSAVVVIALAAIILDAIFLLPMRIELAIASD